MEKATREELLIALTITSAKQIVAEKEVNRMYGVISKKNDEITVLRSEVLKERIEKEKQILLVVKLKEQLVKASNQEACSGLDAIFIDILECDTTKERHFQPTNRVKNLF
jgi:hypothetical protein